MPSTALSPEIQSLSIPERIALVEQIWDSIAEESQAFELSAAQKAELDRRLDAAQQAPRQGAQ
jgi:putative addiction module component (TIGR02574 family)